MSNACVVVVGAGVAGLAAAATIRREAPQADVVVLEQRARAGGLVETERTPDGFVIEHGADALVTTKPWGVAVASAPGFGDTVVAGGAAPRRSYVATPGGLVVLPPIFAGADVATALALLRSPLLSLPGKLRLALEPLVAARRSDGDESVRAFVARRFGAELADAVVEPLMGGIYGQETARLSAKACLPRLLELEHADGSVTLGIRRLVRARRRERDPLPPTVTFGRGMASLPEALQRALGERVVLGVAVQRIARRATSGFAVETARGAIPCDAVVVATPAWQAPQLLEGLSPDLAATLATIAHKAFACVTLAFERSLIPHPLDGTGWVRGAGDLRATLACTWSSEKWWGRAPRGHALVRCMLPLDPAGDDDLVAAARADLRDVLGVAAAPSLTRVRRLPRATPIYEVGHGDRVAAALAAADAAGALALAGNAYGGVGVPDCGTSGETAARAVLAKLAQRTAPAVHCQSVPLAGLASIGDA